MGWLDIGSRFAEGMWREGAGLCMDDLVVL